MDQLSAGIGLFNTCLHAYRLISKAIELESDALIWDVLMRIERTRFEVWGRIMGFLDEKTGLPRENPGSSSIQDLDALLQTEPARILMLDILRSIHKVLEDFEGTKEKYRLDQRRERKQGAETASSDSGSKESRVRKKLDQVWESTKIFSSHLIMTIKDKDKVDQLLKTLTTLNNGLENLLSLSQKVQSAKALSSGVLLQYRTIKELDVVLEASASAMEQNTMLSTTAQVKRQCLEVHSIPSGVQARDKGTASAAESRNDHAISPATNTCLLDLQLLALDKAPRKTGADILWPVATGTWKATDGTPTRVLVEWRSTQPISPGFDVPATEFQDRRDRLVQLLHETATMPKAKDYLTLDCFGYVEDVGRQDGIEKSLVGFVSRFPEWADDTKDPVSLHELLSRAFEAENPGGVPSLGTRFNIALRISGALYQLHCSQWLHRNLGSPQIVFFHDKTNPTPTLRLDEPRVIGLQYSRPDDQDHLDRGASEGFAKWGSLSLYLHPDHSGRPRRYRRSDDVYSLGVVLFEIAFWEPAWAFHQHDKSTAEVAGRILETAKVELAAEVGDRYCSAVLGCLKGLRDIEPHIVTDYDDAVRYEGKYSGEDPEYGLESELLWKVVGQIQKCTV